MKKEEIRKVVRKGYAKAAQGQRQKPCSCGDLSKELGYTEEELKSIPEGADLSLGCGNPVALASLKKGETVVDLGAGAGIDCFLAANKVGPKGRVIGVDMTPGMLDKARANAEKGGYKNVEFRLGEIENLPVADDTANVVISNCVINLSPDKRRVFEEALRALKPGGRLMVSDIVLLKVLPPVIRRNVQAYVGCLSGAIMKDKYLELIREAGFSEVKVIEEAHFPVEFMANDPTAKAVMRKSNIPTESLSEIAYSVASVKVYGQKPIATRQF